MTPLKSAPGTSIPPLPTDSYATGQQTFSSKFHATQVEGHYLSEFIVQQATYTAFGTIGPRTWNPPVRSLSLDCATTVRNVIQKVWQFFLSTSQ
ncbi:hypothetical protein AVEN_249361-1 [Araneus ventricosus]|uniref:Uncharacterized protein n=1 Tax=Araneus ventricosus TaxID=182803 RepID=A0A4Y2URM0_ARAVE|nr:hypothetical protein AVEN_249361-1 [Araneus ventricosus]